MRIASRLFFFLCLLIGLTWSCTQAVTIGSDFLDDQQSDLVFTDDFTLTFNTEVTDSVITYSPNVSYQLITYLLGNIEEEIFGYSTSEIYAQPQLPIQGTDLIGSTLDSVVLQLRYDTLGSYGDLTAEVKIEVFQLAETPDYTQDYYSNVQFDRKMEMLGSVTFIPHPKDSIDIANDEDTIRTAAHIRIPLDKENKVFQDLIKEDIDSLILTTQEVFQNYFHGIYIRLTGSNNTMLGINLLNSLSGLVFYYDTPVEENHIFKLVFTSARVNCTHMQHDYRGSIIENTLTLEPEANKWYLQGMAGVRTRMKIEGLELLPEAVINQAVLEVYATIPEGDDDVLYPPCPYIVTQEQTDSTLNYDMDVRVALAVAQGNHLNGIYNILFGGKRGERMPGPPVIYKYEMKLTNKVKEILEGNKENILYFNPFSKSDFPHRAVLLGPNDPIYAPRLRVYYTKI